MNVFKEAVAVCGGILILELATRLCDNEQLVRFVRSLAVLVLLLSTVTGFFSVDWRDTISVPSTDPVSEELTGYVQEATQDAVEQRAVQEIQGLLATVGLSPKKIQVRANIGVEGSIVLDRVYLEFPYETDVERARALLKGVFDGKTKVEVELDGN